MLTFPGQWNALFAHPEGIGHLILTQQKVLTLRINGEVRGTMDLPESLLYLDACASPDGTVGFIAQPQTTSPGTMVGIFGLMVKIAPVMCYNRPAVAYENHEIIGYVQTSKSTWRRGLSGEDQPIPIWPGGTGETSQGIAQVIDGHVIWRDEVGPVPVGHTQMLHAVQANGVIVGQGQETGAIGLTPDNHPFLALDFAPEDVKIAYSPVRNVWAVAGWNLTPTVAYAELPPFTPLPTPQVRMPHIAPFNHRVLVAPFKGPIPGLQTAEEIGRFSEDADITLALAEAIAQRKRVCWCWDSAAMVHLPKGLRPRYDQVWLELYRTKGESLAQSQARWDRNLMDVLAKWSGVIGVIPMLYGQGGAPPDELWSEQEVLDSLTTLSDLVNRSSRIQVVAPFAYQRANGIIAHQVFQEALAAIVTASPGVPMFEPVPDVIVPGPTPVPTPLPVPKAFFEQVKEYRARE